MDAVVPGVTEGLHHFRFARDVADRTVLHVRRLRRGLPVRIELDAVGRIKVDHLHLAAKALVLGKGRHHLQRVAEDHAVLPPFFVIVEAGLGVRIEVFRQRAEGHLRVRIRAADRRLALHLLNEHTGKYLLLLVDERRRGFQRVDVVRLLAAPDVLRIKVGITRGELVIEGRRVAVAERILHDRRLTPHQLFARNAAVLASRQCRTLVLTLHLIRLNRSRRILFRLLSHKSLP